jgi:hypothetical protein
MAVRRRYGGKHYVRMAKLRKQPRVIHEAGYALTPEPWLTQQKPVSSSPPDALLGRGVRQGVALCLSRRHC